MRHVAAVAVLTSIVLAIVLVDSMPVGGEATSVYVLRDPIAITGNAGFTRWNGVRYGSGTPSDPYVIASWEISAYWVDGIRIEGTDAYVVIRNVYVHWTGSPWYAIKLISAAHVRIENSTLVGYSSGVRMEGATSVAIVGNEITGSASGGIFGIDTRDVQVSDNQLLENGYGIGIQRSSEVDVARNRISNTLGYGSGVSFDGVTNGTIWENEILAAGWGIEVDYSNSVEVRNNTLRRAGTGLSIYGSSWVRFTGNVLEMAVYAGLRFNICSNITMVGNELKGESQVTSCTRLTLIGNRFERGGLRFEGSVRDDFASHTIGLDNEVAGRPIRYLRDCAGVEVDGLVAAQVLVAGCTNVRIAHLNISGAAVGIQVAFTQAAVVEDNVVSNGSYGMVFYAVTDSQVRRNLVARNSVRGIVVSASTRLALVENEILENPMGVELGGSIGTVFQGNRISRSQFSGVYHKDSLRSVFTQNVFVSDGIYFKGSQDAWDSHVIGEDNTANGLPIRYFARCRDASLDGALAGQVIVASCQNVRFAGLVVSDTDAGMQIAYSDRVRIESSIVSDSYYEGVRFLYSGNSTLRGSRVSRAMYGVSGTETLNLTVSSNVVREARTGIALAGMVRWSSGSGTIAGNLVADVETALEVIGFGPVLVTGNEVVRAGLLTGTYYSGGLHLYHNNFVDNLGGSSDIRGGVHTWDNGYPSGGNYWSNYAGVDNCSGPSQNVCPSPDGIGDTPMRVEGGGVDRYPLMYPVQVVILEPLKVVVGSKTTRMMSNETATIRVRLTSGGTGVPGGHVAVTSSPSGNVSEVTDHGDGNYTFRWTAPIVAATTIALIRVSAKVGGYATPVTPPTYAITLDPNMTNPANPTPLFAVLLPERTVLRPGETTLIRVYLYTREGYPVAGASVVAATLGGGTVSAVVDELNGLYTFSYTAPVVTGDTWILLRITASKFGYRSVVRSMGLVVIP